MGVPPVAVNLSPVPAAHPLMARWLTGFLSAFPLSHRAYIASVVRRGAADRSDFYDRAEAVIRDMAAVLAVSEDAVGDLGAMAGRATLFDLAPSPGPTGLDQLLSEFCRTAEYPVYEHGSFVWLPAHAERLAFTMARCTELGATDSKTLLEVGFGPGEFMATILQVCPAWQAVGVDISPACVDYADRLLRRRGVRERTDLRLGDLRQLPFADASFDVVIANEVVEHLPDPGAGVRELTRLLRPEGTAIITLPLRMPMRTHMTVFPDAGAAAALLESGGLQPCVTAVIDVLGRIGDAMFACRLKGA